MNIDALLSPSDSSSRDDPSASPSAAGSPLRTRPGLAGRMASGLREEFMSASPDSSTSTRGHSGSPSLYDQPSSNSHGYYPSPGVPSHPAPTSAAASALRASPPQTTSSPAVPPQPPSRHGHAQVAQRPGASRFTSTPQMETLADLAAMRQREPTTRTYSADSVRTVKAGRSRGNTNTSIPPVPRHQSIVRLSSNQPSVDFIMAEASSSTPEPRSVESTALSPSQSKEISELLSYLAEHSYVYDSHVRLLRLLHHGFVSYAKSTADPTSKDHPSSFALLSELRQARTAMDTRFAVGEDLWLDWLSDEIVLARSSEDRIRVTELCQKAVQDEPASVKLWQIYAGWIASNHAACHDLPGSDQQGWSAEDKEVCKELFTREMLLNVLEQATAATQWRLDESHVLWNRYAELVLEDVPSKPSEEDVSRLRGLFLRRLQVPHVAWNETKQFFWQVVSKYDANNWEAIMDEVNKTGAPGLKQLSLRERHESNLRQFIDSGDREAEANEFSQYLQWEKKQANKNNTPAAYQLRRALYERAVLRFPTAHDWWIDYVDFVISSNTSEPVLPLIERATRHCPWSGDLWGRRILRSDVERKPREEIEATKHRATNSGLLDVGGMEELLKVLQQWCSYLRRYAFRSDAAEDDRDVAELGITAALDDIAQAGLKLYGKDFEGDPLYRIEKIQIKFLVEARRFDEARQIYRRLVPLQKNGYNFWHNYYTWELWVWGYERLVEPRRVETAENGPHLPSGVLQEALSQRNLDWPEQLLDLYLNHFQQHESGDKLQAAMIDAREFARHLAIRRAKEAEEAAAHQAHAAAAAATSESLHDSSTPTSEKRKRDDEEIPNGHGSKKAKTEETSAAIGSVDEPGLSASAQVKRDREHNVLTLKDLPSDVTDLDIKKFFRDVGVPLSINILEDKSGDVATATVEFENHDDVLAAKTRSGKILNGHEVRIQSGTQSTLYVANYPPEYDEVSMRKLFDGYGEVVSVRFPSLKFNNRRRFCYVQFMTAEMAKAAEAAMDSKMLDGQHRLLAKISDPDAKKQRSGAQAEGRELCIKNIERSVPDHAIKQFFEQYGSVVSMNAVKLVNGKRTGTAFVVFSSADEATAALEANNKPFHDRILHVELASSKARADPLDRAKKEDIIIKRTTSNSPEPEGTNGRRGSDISMTSSAANTDDNWKTARERKVAIFNLLDTVNDARIRTAMEVYGPLVKIQMRRADNGAIVEFANVQDAFNVRQGVDCAALGEGVKTGDVADLLAHVKKRQTNTGFTTSMQPPAHVSRPGQRGSGPGRRGGLGFRRGGGLGMGKSGDSEANSTEADGVAAAPASTTGAAKSNAEFRALFEKSRENQAAAE